MTQRVDGLVLAGGASSRMGTDKNRLRYGGRPAQLRHTVELLRAVSKVVYCARPGSAAGLEDLPDDVAVVDDAAGVAGPLAGILAGLRATRSDGLLVLANDLPFIQPDDLLRLVDAAANALAVAYRSPVDGRPEPLCALYSKGCCRPLEAFVASGGRSPRAFLARTAGVKLIEIPDPGRLANINTPDEYDAACARFAGDPPSSSR